MRFAIAVDGTVIKFEIIMEGRIELGSPDYRKRCFTSLRIIEPSKVINGIDLMAADLCLGNLCVSSF